MPTAENSIEVRIKGRWVRVPVLDVNGNKVIATGSRLRTAFVRGEDMMQDELEDPGLYIRMLKSDANQTLKADIFTFTQKLPATQPKYTYPMEWDSISAIHLVTFTEWWEDLPQETRKNVRRSCKRNVKISVRGFDDDLIRRIKQVNDDSLLRQGLPNGYFGKSIEETRKLYGEFGGRCDFICACVDEELIGFLHLVYRGDIASILNLTTKPSHSDKRPANALVAKAVELCDEKHISYITYGRYNYGNKRDNPLRQFKVRNGFTEVLVPRYFVPLTRWGRLCMKAKLHRGLVGILPHSVIMVGVGARSLWYKFKVSMSRRSSMLERPNRNRLMERSNPPAGSTSAPH